ncbi:MAG TPA: AlkA N-terminal domain-containing protein [Candidatus Acidoferrales bacterium]|nr:AlkA N-terminal domain-containing protein [Candidatus Acidoferrales bacterium]
MTSDSASGNVQLDPAFCWQAVYSRDHRFDGRFFAGIFATRVYCRSICPVSFGDPEGVHWFHTPAAAEAAGFRPCRRCRPDTSPGSSAWFGTWAVVSHALKLISEGALDGGNLEQLAERVGIGSRHLRRLFQRHLGASPLKIARSHRVLVAKSLIVETQLPVAEIALSTGFRSIRQFNHSVRTAFRKSPTAIRRLHGNAAVRDPLGGIIVHLPYRPPFDWASLIRFFGSRVTPGVESVEHDVYQRTVEVGGVAGAIEVWHEASHARLSMRVLLPGCDRLMQVVQRARRLFDLGADTLHIGSYLARDARLAEMVMRRPGLRMPGAWDGFELAVLAVLGQNLTARDPVPAVERLVKTFGRPLQAPISGLTHLFPLPEILAGANLDRVGIPARQALTIGSLARAVLAGTLAFDSIKGGRDAALYLHSLLGLEQDTTAYIAMRALGDPDAFSCATLAFRRVLASDRSPVSADEVTRLFEECRPWRGYAAMHYWTAMQQPVRRFDLAHAARSSNARSIRRRSTVSRRPPFRS